MLGGNLTPSLVVWYHRWLSRWSFGSIHVSTNTGHAPILGVTIQGPWAVSLVSHTISGNIIHTSRILKTSLIQNVEDETAISIDEQR